MERCDFSSIITTVRKYIGDDRGMNQIDLLYELFEGFLEEESSQDLILTTVLSAAGLTDRPGSAPASPDIISIQTTGTVWLMI